MRRVSILILLALLVCAGTAARAAGTNSLVWNPATDLVSADLRGEAREVARVGRFERGGDVFARNIVMGAYRPARMELPKWGAAVDFNLFTTSQADRQKFAAKGCDANSLVGDAEFVNPSAGDFRVKATSPALKLGFVNFPMNQFGVQSPRLKAIARTPEITLPTGSGLVAAAAQTNWLGATVRELAGEEYSAFGLAADARGVLVAQAPNASAAFRAGLLAGDFVQRVNGRMVKNLAEFVAILGQNPAGQPFKLDLLRSYQRNTVEIFDADHNR